MKQFLLMRAIAVLNLILLLILASIMFNTKETASASQVPVTAMSDGAQQVSAPVIATPVPAWSLSAAEAGECPNIFSLQDASSTSAMAAVPKSVQATAETYQLSPDDPSSFSGIYTVSQLNNTGLNPGVLEGNESLSAEYLLVVSHGNWPLPDLDYSSGLNNDTGPAQSSQRIEWQYKILDPNTGDVVGGDYITSDTTCH